MPQLDTYTFLTQISSLSLFFGGFLFLGSNALLRLYFDSELKEVEMLENWCYGDLLLELCWFFGDVEGVEPTTWCIRVYGAALAPRSNGCIAQLEEH